jgi:hypothetical protein
MNRQTVELHFIDGPLQGTRKMEDESIILLNRAYRYLEPTKFRPERIVPNNTDNVWIDVTCVEYFYLPFPLPRSYNGPQRFAMLLEKGLN